MNTDTGTLELKDGYSRVKNPPTRTFRAMTPDEAKDSGKGAFNKDIYFTSDFKTFRRCRANGAAKTWKTRPDVELPVKYGMYECARAESASSGGREMRLPNGGILLVEVAS